MSVISKLLKHISTEYISAYTEPFITITYGRYTFEILDLSGLGCWQRGSGYDCIWDYWSFGMMLNVERISDYHWHHFPSSKDPGNSLKIEISSWNNWIGRNEN